MWFRLFVLFRIPFSILCLAGFVNAFGFGGAAVASALGVPFVVGLLVFSGAVTSKLWNCRPGAVTWAWWLLALEVAGAFLFAATHNLATGQNLDFVAVWGCVVLVAWAAPNAAALYWRRWMFVSAPDVKK